MGSSFSSLQTEGYTTGNMGSENSLTIGLDCSGYVSSAYKLKSKYGTADFIKFGHTISLSDLKKMDFFVCRYQDENGEWVGHVVLCEKIVDGMATIYESHAISKTDGKTEKNEKNVSNYSSPYIARSPFCVQCNKLGAIEIYTEGHVYNCSSCGEAWPVEAHTYVNGSCSVCGSY